MGETINPYQPPASETAGAPDAPLPIEPFTSATRLFGRAFGVYFANFGLIAKITLSVFLPVELAKNFLVHGSHLEENVGANMRIESIVEWIFGSLVTAAIVIALSRKLTTGQEPTLGEALRAGASRWGNVVGARIRSGLFIGLGLILLIVPGVIAMVRYALTDEVAALEHDRSAARSMNRSQDLVAGHGWKIFGVVLLASLVVMPLQFAGGMLSGAVDNWIATAMIDTANDVIYRFFAVVMLLAYLGLAQPQADA